MEGLGQTDLGVLGELVADAGECDRLADFPAHALGLVRRLIPCDTASYNEVGDTPERITAITDPSDHARVSGVSEGFSNFAHQNPLVRHYRRTSSAVATRMSDFIPLCRLRELELYHEVYRPLEVDHQLAISIPAGEVLIGVTVNRGGRDFSDRELRLFDAAGGLLRLTHSRLVDRERLAAALAALEHLVGGAAGLLWIGRGGRLEAGYPAAERLLLELGRDGADETLAVWLRARRSRLAPLQQLRIRVGGRILTARHIPGRAGGPDAIVLAPEPACTGPEALRALGLSPRQAEILHLLWLGHANVVIAQRLEISEHTVRHHLERIYRLLGVSSRAGAAARATEQLLRERS